MLLNLRRAFAFSITAIVLTFVYALVGTGLAQVAFKSQADGSITVRFKADAGEDAPPNCIVTPQGWNYLIRLYRPRAEFFDGIWTVPSLTSISGSKGA